MPLFLPLALLVAAGARQTRPPDAAEARQQLRACLSGDTEPEPRVVACRRAAELATNKESSVTIRLVLAQRLLELSRWDEAAAVYRGLSDQQPDQPEWPLRLAGALLFGAGRPEAAELAAREALRRSAEVAEAWSLLGVSLNRQGRHAEAVAALERARQLDAEFVASRPSLSQALQASRRGEVWPPP